MTVRHRATGGLVRLGIALALGGIALEVSAMPASADCDGPVPSFEKATATAQRVIVGDVVAVEPGGFWDPSIDGRSSWFTIRVRNVLRGEVPAVMEIRDLPTQPCASVVLARTGDRVAIAFDALDFEPPIHVNTAAWIRGTPPPGFETIGTSRVLSLMGLPATDTKAPGPTEPGTPVEPILGALVAVVTALVFLKALAPRRSE